MTIDEIMARYRPLLSQVPGIVAVPQNPPPIRIESQFSRAQYQFAMQSPDTRHNGAVFGLLADSFAWDKGAKGS